MSYKYKTPYKTQADPVKLEEIRYYMARNAADYSERLEPRYDEQYKRRKQRDAA